MSDNSDPTILFTHIPKTAGTSVHKAIFEPNIPVSQRWCSRGLRNLIMEASQYRYLYGHMPYGHHRFIAGSGPYLYFVVLRDPVERAISHYYNILHPRGDKDFPDHPDYEVARSSGLTAFYRRPRFQNVQTRMIAGFLASRLARWIDLNKSWLGQVVLRMARRNLRSAYTEIGLTEQFKETVERFADRLGWSYQLSDKDHKAVPDRPTAEDLDEQTRASLRALNSLDLELYDTARKIFARRGKTRPTV